MNLSPTRTRLALVCAALVLPFAAQAQTASFVVPFDGSGNVSIFDPAATSGGWVGSINDSSSPLSFVSFVLFDLNNVTRQLTGTFEFTTTDLASSLMGTVSGFSLSPTFADTGGRLLLNYTIASGTGQYTGATGFATSQLTYVNDPFAFDNYTETGLIAFAVPEPGTYALMAVGLMAIGGLSLRRRQVQG